MKAKLTLFSLLTLATIKAWSLEVLFGPEITLSNQEILNGQTQSLDEMPVYMARNRNYLNPELTRYRNALKDAYQKLLNANAASRGFDSEFRDEFSSTQGWKFYVGVDPGVIEFTSNPMSLREFELYKTDLNKMFFEIPKSLGLEPQLFAGGGHLNIGVKAFKDKPWLLRNFIADFIIHNELSMGIFNYDNNNAINPWLLSESNIQRMQNVTAQSAIETPLSKDYLRSLQDVFVSNSKDQFVDVWKPSNRPRRGRAIAITIQNILDWDEARIEIRCLRPQQSYDMFLRQIRLLQARINYLEKLGPQPLKVEPILAFQKLMPDQDLKAYSFDPPVNPEEALAAFYKYVTESGEKWEDHRDYIWPRWIENGELKKFEDGLMKSSCSSLLSSTKD